MSLAQRLRRLLPRSPLPPHFMACAPLDVWYRLFSLRPRIPWRFWPRMLLALYVSGLMTLLTLPERLVLAPILLMRRRSSRHTIRHPAGTLIVLGYFRSGTTHLHNLLACDRSSRTPRWFESLVPQGFLLSWTFLRLFLLGCLSTRRPQDDMAFGPEWPAEDDFASNNWRLASSLPGRIVVPALAGHFQRFHFLEDLSTREHADWRACQWAFLAKLRFLSPSRRLLLKTPSHTARVPRLLDLFGHEKVKFIHMSRSADDVVRSNVAMLERMSMYNLQNLPPTNVLTDFTIDEYDRTERAFLDAKAHIPADSLAFVRFEDLTADPIGELKRIYDELRLPWTAAFESAAERYLDSVRDYRTAGQKRGDTEYPPLPSFTPRLAWMHKAFQHDRPPRAAVPARQIGYSSTLLHQRAKRAYFALPFIALLGTGAWLGLAMLRGDRSDWMVWPLGIALGWAALRLARVGTFGLGVWAGSLTFMALLSVAFPATRLVYYKDNPNPTSFDMWDATWKELHSGATLTWTVVGVLTAYKLASRRSGIVPGGS